MTARIRTMEPMRDWATIKSHIHAIMVHDAVGFVCENDEDGTFYGAIVFDSFTPNSAQSHVCVLNPIRCFRAKLVECAAHYVFIQRDKKAVYGLVPSNNNKAQKFDEHLGYREIARLPEAFDDGVDYIIYEAKREDSRWITQPSALDKVNYGR